MQFSWSFNLSRVNRKVTQVIHQYQIEVNKSIKTCSHKIAFPYGYAAKSNNQDDSIYLLLESNYINKF